MMITFNTTPAPDLASYKGWTRLPFSYGDVGIQYDYDEEVDVYVVVYGGSAEALLAIGAVEPAMLQGRRRGLDSRGRRFGRYKVDGHVEIIRYIPTAAEIEELPNCPVAFHELEVIRRRQGMRLVVDNEVSRWS